MALLVLGREGGQEDRLEKGGRRLAARAMRQGHDLVARRGRRRLNASMRPKTAASRSLAAVLPLLADGSRRRGSRHVAPRTGGRGYGQVSLDGLPECQCQRILDLLNPVDAVGPYDQTVVNRIAHGHAGSFVAAQANRESASARRFLEARSMSTESPLVEKPMAMSNSLAWAMSCREKHELKPHIVGERCEDRLVIDQRQGRQRRPVRWVAEQLCRPLGIGGAPTVAEAEEAPTAREAFCHVDRGALRPDPRNVRVWWRGGG